MVQLSGGVLADLIVNSIVAYCAIYDMVARRTATPIAAAHIRNDVLFDFCKATQRIYLAKLLYGRTIVWLDSKASAYVSKMRSRHPISTATPAPRLHTAHHDLPLEDIYGALPNIRRYRASLRKERRPWSKGALPES
jgi:hypothetical protein